MLLRMSVWTTRIETGVPVRESPTDTRSSLEIRLGRRTSRGITNSSPVGGGGGTSVTAFDRLTTWVDCGAAMGTAASAAAPTAMRGRTRTAFLRTSARLRDHWERGREQVVVHGAEHHPLEAGEVHVVVDDALV